VKFWHNWKSWEATRLPKLSITKEPLSSLTRLWSPSKSPDWICRVDSAPPSSPGARAEIQT
jgi:hypothetical protein